MIEVQVLLSVVITTAVLVCAVVGLGFWLGRIGQTAPYDPYRDKPEYDGTFRSETLTWKPEEEPEEEMPSVSLPINPDTPPTWKTYNPVNPDAGPKFCRCHGLVINKGERILWWPNPETGGVDLLCEQGVNEAEEAKNA